MPGKQDDEVRLWGFENNGLIFKYPHIFPIFTTCTTISVAEDFVSFHDRVLKLHIA